MNYPEEARQGPKIHDHLVLGSFDVRLERKKELQACPTNPVNKQQNGKKIN